MCSRKIYMIVNQEDLNKISQIKLEQIKEELNVKIEDHYQLIDYKGIFVYTIIFESIYSNNDAAGMREYSDIKKKVYGYIDRDKIKIMGKLPINPYTS